MGDLASGQREQLAMKTWAFRTLGEYALQKVGIWSHG